MDPPALNPVVADIDVQTQQWTILLPLSAERQVYGLKAQHYSGDR